VLALIDRIGRRPLAQAGALLLALLSVGYMFVDRVGPLVYALQALTGASFVLAFNANITLATDEVPPERLGQAIGILGAANMSMNAVATAVGERVAETAGWSTVFSLGALAAVVALVLSFAIVEDRSLVPTASSAPGSTPRLGALLPLLGVSALVGATFSAMFTFQQPYAVELGARRISEFFVGFTATAVAVRLLLGSLGDRHGRKRISALSLILYGTVALVTAKLRVGFLWAYGAAFGLAHGVLYPTLNAYAIEVVSPRERGRVIALYNGAFNVGTALSALAWGALAEHAGYPAVFVSAAVLSYAAVVLLQNSPHRARA
jgi:MFS family permease